MCKVDLRVVSFCIPDSDRLFGMKIAGKLRQKLPTLAVWVRYETDCPFLPDDYGNKES